MSGAAPPPPMGLKPPQMQHSGPRTRMTYHRPYAISVPRSSTQLYPAHYPSVELVTRPCPSSDNCQGLPGCRIPSIIIVTMSSQRRYKEGIGWGMVVVSALVALYYNMIIAWVLFYFFASFRKTLMWERCNNPWNTELCYSRREDEICDKTFETGSRFFNQTCWNESLLESNNINLAIGNFSVYMNDSSATLKSPADEYFHNYVLEIGDSLENLGGISWKLVLCLLGAWIIVFLCLIKGVQSTGKVVYFTATFPYLVLVILLVRGATLEGSLDGVIFYINPNFTRLADMQVWKDAATQIFYSLGPAFGGLITMSSYNRFNNNCYRDALLVAIGNCLTSVFAGFVIFSIIGFLAHDLNVDIKDVTNSGPGLAFIIYPEALTRMPVGPVWSLLFFFMLVTLGLDSQFAMLETVTTAFLDQFPPLRKWKHFVVGGSCLFMFIVGLPLCTNGGFYVFTLINDYSAGYCLILLALSELVVVMYIYGVRRFCKDVAQMIGFEPGWYWKATWFVITPLFLVFILISSFVDYSPSKYREYTFTPLAEGIGWLISLVSILCVPVFAIFVIIKFRRAGRTWESLIRTTKDWCPAEERLRREKQELAMKARRTGPTVISVNGADLPPPAYQERF